MFCFFSLKSRLTFSGYFIMLNKMRSDIGRHPLYPFKSIIFEDYYEIRYFCYCKSVSVANLEGNATPNFSTVKILHENRKKYLFLEPSLFFDLYFKRFFFSTEICPSNNLKFKYSLRMYFYK